MGSFMDGLKSTLNDERSVTENGAVGFRTTGRSLLDLHFAVSSLRNASEKEIQNRFTKAFFEDKLTAMKWLFYARDVRGGLGERRLFRTCMVSLAKENPEYVAPLVHLIPEYGRWDDLWCLLDTPMVDAVMRCVGYQIGNDLCSRKKNRPISLLAKWMPRCKTSSKQTRHYAAILRKGLGMTERQYQHLLADLSRYLVVVEQQMSSGQWDAIDYQRVPSRANLMYNSAFLRHDEDRRRAFLAALEKGEAKINAGTLFPHDIVSKYTYGTYHSVNALDQTLEALWKALPDTVQGCGNTIVVADGSGSMTTRIGGTTALDVANALAIYFAERSSGQFKDNYITFSERPQLVDLSKGKNLREKILIALRHSEVANTNIEAVFDLILATAINKRMGQSELPANILIISDMEFDSCATSNIRSRRWGSRVAPTPTLFEEIANRYAEAGYQLPRLVFWNVNSRTGAIPVKENSLGVALVSGFSPNVAKMVMSGKLDPYDCLLESINSERYQIVDDILRPVIFD